MKNISIKDLSKLSDIIVGTESMLLLEMAMIRNDVISLRPNAKCNFIGNTCEAVIPLENIFQIKSAIHAKPKKIKNLENYLKIQNQIF